MKAFICSLEAPYPVLSAGVFAIIVGALPCKAAAECDWPKFRRSPDNTGYSDCEATITTGNASNLTRKWSTAHGKGSPAVANGVVYIQGSDGTHAYEAVTGDERWVSEYGSTTASHVVGDTAYVAGSSGIVALDVSDGSVRWSRGDISAIDTSVTVVEGIVYATAGDDKVHALQADDGTTKWATPLSTVTGFTIGSPAVVDGVVYVSAAGPPGAVYALDAASGALEWSAPAGGFVVGSPAVSNGRVYVGSTSGQVWAFDASNGGVVWVRQTGPIGASPAIGGGVVFVGDLGGILWAFDAMDGLPVADWVPPVLGPILSSPAVANGVVFVGALSPDPAGVGNFFALNASTGKKLWSYTLPEPVSSSPAIADGVVYVGTNETAASGALHAFGLP